MHSKPRENLKNFMTIVSILLILPDNFKSKPPPPKFSQ